MLEQDNSDLHINCLMANLNNVLDPKSHSSPWKGG